MTILLDTHTLAWWLWGDPRLSQTARLLIFGSPKQVLVSAVSAWEIATKFRIGKWPEAAVLANDFEALVAEQQFQLFDISAVHGRMAGLMASSHKDPFDRLLAAQAITRGILLVTNDPKIAELGAATVW